MYNAKCFIFKTHTFKPIGSDIINYSVWCYQVVAFKMQPL